MVAAITSSSPQTLGAAGSTSAGTASDVVRALNPLLYIPGVSTLYSAATGEKAPPAMSILLGFATGGPAGFAAALANAFVEQATGKTLLGNAAALLSPAAEAAPSGFGPPAADVPASGDAPGQVKAASVDAGVSTTTARPSTSFLLTDDMVRLGAFQVGPQAHRLPG
jgi:hypothetical protein